MESIQDRIRQRLDELGLSMKATSIAAGLGETAIRDILNREGHSPKESTIKKLAPELQTTVIWLMTGRGEKDGKDTAEIVNLWDRIPDQYRGAAQQMLEGLAEKKGEE